MSKAATSVFVFSIYMFILGIVLLIAPNFLLGLFGIPATDEIWIKVVGMLVFILGTYYFVAARSESVAFFQASILGRFGVLAFFIAFVLLGMAPPALIIFGVIDAAAAAWTAFSLRG